MSACLPLFGQSLREFCILKKSATGGLRFALLLSSMLTNISFTTRG